jgi:hypothetical protein
MKMMPAKTMARDAVKVSAKAWDKLTPKQREPYVEQHRKNGFVYATRPTVFEQKEESDAD